MYCWQTRHRAHTESQREESGESQFLGSLWRATLSREAWMPIWGLSTESMKPWPPPGGGRGYRTKRWRWCGGTGVPGGHDTHRPFTNRKAAPGEGTVIRARVGRPVPSGARSAQGPVHFPPTWRVIMGRCHPGQPGQGRRARAEGGMGAKREGANGVSGMHRWGMAKAEGHEDCSSVCARGDSPVATKLKIKPRRRKRGNGYIRIPPRAE